MSLEKPISMVNVSHSVTDIISNQTSLPPLSANVIICFPPPPPFVSQCQHFVAADIICEQPLTWIQLQLLSHTSLLIL